MPSRTTSCVSFSRRSIPSQLRLDLLGERRLVDLDRLVGVGLPLLDACRHLLALGRQLFRHLGTRERLAFRQRVEQPQGVLAGELPAGTGAAVDGLLRHGEVGGAEVRRLAAALAPSKPQRFVGRMVQREELVLEDKASPVLRRLRVGRSGLDEVLGDRDHSRRPIGSVNREGDSDVILVARGSPNNLALPRAGSTSVRRTEAGWIEATSGRRDRRESPFPLTAVPDSATEHGYALKPVREMVGRAGLQRFARSDHCFPTSRTSWNGCRTPHYARLAKLPPDAWLERVWMRDAELRR